MRTVSWLWFVYFLFGFIAGGGIVYLWGFFKRKTTRLAWYEWILSILAFLMLILMVQTFIASLEEGQLQAAWMSLFFLGIPIVLLAVGTIRSVRSRLKSN